jgi:hypothetical protein
MSEDLVARLEAAALSGDMPLGQAFNAAEIAAEIERLRAEMDRLALRSCTTCRFGYIDSVGMADCAMFDKVFKPDHYCAKWEVRRG